LQAVQAVVDTQAVEVVLVVIDLLHLFQLLLACLLLAKLVAVVLDLPDLLAQ
jgi:hypothetical protein